MKNLFSVLILFYSVVLLGQVVPQKFSFQALVRDSNNTLLLNKKIGVRISVLYSSETGSSVFSEIHTSTTNPQGLVSISIGNGKIVSGDFSKIEWLKGRYFVKTEIDILGGTNYQLNQVSELISVPYALYALNSQKGSKGEQGDIGVQGPIGDIGPQGPQGISSQFKYFTSSIGDTLHLNNSEFVLIPNISYSNLKPIVTNGEIVKDIDGNTYKTVIIGEKQWFAENLKVTRYNDGRSIDHVSDQDQWSNLTKAAWCNYNNSDSLGLIYGKLYNGYCFGIDKVLNVCPVGWHVASTVDLELLGKFLGNTNTFLGVGGKLKETGNFHWHYPNNNASNILLFNALPGGMINSTGLFEGLTENGYFHVSYKAQFSSLSKFSSLRILSSESSDFLIYPYSKINMGASIRCVKD